MRRRRLIEIHEQRWLPQSLRRDVTDLLQCIVSRLGYSQLVAPALKKAMHSTRSDQVVDLCSGSGGPWQELVALVSDENPVTVVLTDKFPQITNGNHQKARGRGSIMFWQEAVDAERVPQALRGFRTVFNSFHHFEPAAARRILRDAVEHREGFASFELAQRKLFTMFSAIFMGLATFFATPFVRPFRTSLLVWTYLIPVLPLIMWFDGLVSCLRAYTPDELRALAERASVKPYTWETGTVRHRFLPMTVTYLVGSPVETLHAEDPPPSVQRQRHFIGRLEAERLVERAAELAGVQMDGAEAVGAAPVEHHTHEFACDAVAARGRLGVHVKDPRALRESLSGITGPSSQNDAPAGDDAAGGLR